MKVQELDYDDAKYGALGDYAKEQAKAMGAIGIVLLVIEETKQEPGQPPNEHRYCCHTMIHGEHGVQEAMPKLMRASADRIYDSMERERIMRLVQEVMQRTSSANDEEPPTCQ